MLTACLQEAGARLLWLSFPPLLQAPCVPEDTARIIPHCCMRQSKDHVLREVRGHISPGQEKKKKDALYPRREVDQAFSCL